MTSFFDCSRCVTSDIFHFYIFDKMVADNFHTLFMIGAVIGIIFAAYAMEKPAKTTADFDVRTCFGFSRRYLNIIDIPIMASTCTRISVMMESKVDPDELFPIPEEALYAMCDTLITHDPDDMPREVRLYAFLTFKYICKPAFEMK